MILDYVIPVDSPQAIHICQCGSKTGSAANQLAVAFCRESTSPHPYTGRVLYAHLTVFVVLTAGDLYKCDS